MNGHGVGPLRRSALISALHEGLPEHRVEAWKYTSLRALAARPLTLSNVSTAVDPALIADIPTPRLVFVNGVMDADLSQIDALETGLQINTLTQALRGDNPRAIAVLGRRFDGIANVFARINTAFATEGALITVAADAVIHTPLHLVFVGTALEADVISNLRHVLELRENAALTVIEHHRGSGNHRNLSNHLLHVHLKPGSRLCHARIQDEAVGASVIARSEAVLASNACYRRLDLELGASLSRHELNVSLQGDGAQVIAGGVLLADGRRHLDTRLGIEHVAPNSRCELPWRGLAGGRGRAVFHGGIHIRAGADGSDAQLSSRNLLLSEQAEIDSQPVLEIDADEVKAAHGATVGSLDANALFYLRSRGLPEAQARTVLIAAFCREVLDVLADDTLVQRLAPLLDTALARMEQTA
ncbi:MAG: Fe-S cluster assembly protein SufD [Lysobacterales bacterium CG17_big_fil_post_rev_8_21_14_2_50_64_11]|nr:MAG: Fe-S cluster assembly protein SufD [Xanthomonadales bacterium CG17_big_fil_post_rev_8_21_14_2_50_64_11]